MIYDPLLTAVNQVGNVTTWRSNRRWRTQRSPCCWRGRRRMCPILLAVVEPTAVYPDGYLERSVDLQTVETKRASHYLDTIATEQRTASSVPLYRPVAVRQTVLERAVEKVAAQH
jgi:hypothetical protein